MSRTPTLLIVATSGLVWGLIGVYYGDEFVTKYQAMLAFFCVLTLLLRGNRDDQT